MHELNQKLSLLFSFIKNIQWLNLSLKGLVWSLIIFNINYLVNFATKTIKKRKLKLKIRKALNRCKPKNKFVVPKNT